MTDLSSLCQLLCRLTSRPPPAPGSASSSLGSTPSASSTGPASSSGSTPSTLQQQLQQPLKLRQPAVGSGFGDVSSFVYPVLSTLASYPTHLDRKAQVKCSVYLSKSTQADRYMYSTSNDVHVTSFFTCSFLIAALPCVCAGGWSRWTKLTDVCLLSDALRPRAPGNHDTPPP